MQGQFEARRRILIAAYRRYLVADRALQSARGSAQVWLRETPARGIALIGDPGSPIRRLYERRERALACLSVARRALDEARNRPLRRDGRTIFLIELRDARGI